MNKSEFLDSVCAKIKCREAHKYIKNELSAHIDDAAEEYIKNGISREKAFEEAVKHMGNPAEIGKSLNNEHKMKPEISIMLLMLILAIIGFSAVFASRNYGVLNFGKYIINSLLGISLLVAAYFFDYTKTEKHSFKIYAASLCVLYTMSFIGNAYNGNRRFLDIGIFNISSESAFIMFALSFPGMANKFKKRGIGGMAVLSLLALIFVIPIIVMPDTKTVIVIYITFLTVMSALVLKGHFGENRARNILLFGGTNLICIIAAVLSVYGRISYRLAAMRDINGGGWQQHMARFWLDASKWFGKTAVLYDGASIEKTLPASTTDFMPVNISAVFGKATLLILIAAAVIFMIRTFISAFKIKSSYGFALSLCSCSLIALQFILGISVNLGLIPIISASIPFISYGGTGYITNMLLTGIILSVWRRADIVSEITENVSKHRFVYFENKKLIVNFGNSGN